MPVGVRGGGRPKGLPKTGGRKKGSIDKKIRALRARILRDQELTIESTVEAIRRGQQYDIRALFDSDGNVRPITELSEAEAWCIAGFEVVRRNVESGDGHQDTVLKVKLVDRGRYVELAARHQGMLVEKRDVTGTLTLVHELP